MTTVEFAGAPDARTAPFEFDDVAFASEPFGRPMFKAPKFQTDHRYGTYVAGRDPEFKVHQEYGHAKLAITMSNTRLFVGGTTALANCAIYERLNHAEGTVEWVPVETYEAGQELPWRTRSNLS